MRKYPDKDDVFCVLKYKVSFCEDYETMEYAVLILTNGGTSYITTILTSQRAKKMIAEHNMREKINNEHGHVWELPRKSFKRRFCGKYKYRYEEQ
jgi:hypothetical protein